MNIVITERSLLPVRRDKQTGAAFSSGGGGGGGGSMTTGGGGVLTSHSALTQLDYASAGHTGFAPIDSPVFTTQITTPLIYGSVDASGDLILKGTSHATKTSSVIYLQPDGGSVMIGPGEPTGLFHIRKAGACYAAIESTVAGANAQFYFFTTVSQFAIGANIQGSDGAFEIYDYYAAAQRLCIP